MKKVYVLPELIDWLLSNDTEIQNFIFRLSEINNYLLNQKTYWSNKLVIDFKKIEEFAELGLYDLKMFASLWMDTNCFFLNPCLPVGHNDYFYYIIPPLGVYQLNETTDDIHIELAMTSNGYSKVLNRELVNHSILRVHRFNSQSNPVLVTHEYVELKNIEINFFLDNYISRIISQESDFLSFRDSYINFYHNFEWDKWIPSANPAPAHDILNLLAKFYKKSKNESDHLLWGYIMATINGGKFNKELTQLNSTKRMVNDVFQLGINKGNGTLFYSIDTENGNLEIYDYRGIHINKVYGLVSGLQDQNRNYTINVPKSKWHKGL